MSLAEKKQLEKRQIDFYRLFFWGSFICLFIYMVFVSKNIVFSSDDDAASFVNSYGKSPAHMLRAALHHFQIRFRWDPISILAVVLTSLVSNTGSIVVYKLFLYIPIFACIVSIYLFLNKRVGKEFGSLYGIFFLAFVSLDRYYSVMLSYPLTFMMSFILFIVVLEFLYRYYETNKKRYIVIGTIIFFFICMGYESNIAFVIVILAIILQKNTSKEDGKLKIAWKKLFFQALPYIGAIIVFMVGYIISRKLFPLIYNGIDVTSSPSIKNMIRAELSLGLGNFPTANFFREHLYLQFRLDKVTLAMWLKAFISTAVVLAIFRKMQAINFKKGIYIVLVTCVTAAAFLFPFAISQRYEAVTRYSGLYLPCSLTYFLIIVVLVAIAGMLLGIKKLQKPIIAIMCVGVFCVSVVTDFSNQLMIKDMEVVTQKQLQYNRLVHTDYYKNLPEDSVIFTTDFSGLHKMVIFMEEYGSNFTQTKVAYTGKEEDLAGYKNRYILCYDANTQMIFMGKLGDDLSEFRGNELFLIPKETEGGGTYLIEKSTTESPLFVNGVNYDYYPQYAWVGVSVAEPTIIKGEDINYLNVGFATGTFLNNAEVQKKDEKNKDTSSTANSDVSSTTSVTSSVAQ